MLKYILIIITIFIFSCSDENDKNEPIDYNTNGIIPLKIGNYWKYETESYLSRDTFPTYTNNTLTVFRDSIINGTKYFYIINDNYNYTVSTNKEDGYYFNNIDEIDDLYYKYPCEVGDQWDVRIYEEEDLDEKYVIVKSLNEVVTVPFGTFECINYEFYAIEEFMPDYHFIFISNVYISPGVGMVKHTYKSTVPPYTDTTLHHSSYLTDSKIVK